METWDPGYRGIVAGRGKENALIQTMPGMVTCSREVLTLAPGPATLPTNRALEIDEISLMKI
jgi:hypothetical protein